MSNCSHRNLTSFLPDIQGFRCKDCEEVVRTGSNPDTIYPEETEDAGPGINSGWVASPPMIETSPRIVSVSQIGGNHYSRLSVQPFDLIKAMESSGDAFVDYARGCAIKYAARMKGDRQTLIEDLRKGARYLEEAAKRLEEKK